MKCEDSINIEPSLVHYCCRKKPEKLTESQKMIDMQLMKMSMDILKLPINSSNDVPIAALMYNDQTGKIIIETNTTIEKRDPCAHAEMNALRKVSQLCKNHRLPDWTIYITMEPCLMCFGAILEARLKRIVFAAADKKVGLLSRKNYTNFHSAGNHHFCWTGGVMAERASEKIKSFFKEFCR